MWEPWAGARLLCYPELLMDAPPDLQPWWQKEAGCPPPLPKPCA